MLSQHLTVGNTRLSLEEPAYIRAYKMLYDAKHNVEEEAYHEY